MRAVRPHRSPATADPLYEITDPYLAFWFAVLREDADLVEGGQGRAVQQRVRERWQGHLGRVFEEAAREHVVRLVEAGEFPAQMTVGRWWRDNLATVGGADNLAEVDVLGLMDKRTRLVGEARWQSRPLSGRDLQALCAKLRYLPEPHRDVEFAFWSRGGADVSVCGEGAARLFTCADMV